jgi:hypothetical protein
MTSIKRSKQEKCSKYIVDSINLTFVIATWVELFDVDSDGPFLEHGIKYGIL